MTVTHCSNEPEGSTPSLPTYRNSRIQGDVGVARAVLYFTERGYQVSKPMSDSQRYDLIVDDGRLHRVEVKTTSIGAVCLKTSGGNRSGNKIIKLSSEDVDWLFVYNTTTGSHRIYSIFEVENKTQVTLY